MTALAVSLTWINIVIMSHPWALGASHKMSLVSELPPSIISNLHPALAMISLWFSSASCKLLLPSFSSRQSGTSREQTCLFSSSLSSCRSCYLARPVQPSCAAELAWYLIDPPTWVLWEAVLVDQANVIRFLKKSGKIISSRWLEFTDIHQTYQYKLVRSDSKSTVSHKTLTNNNIPSHVLLLWLLLTFNILLESESPVIWLSHLVLQ